MKLSTDSLERRGLLSLEAFASLIALLFTGGSFLISLLNHIQSMIDNSNKRTKK